MRRGHVLPSIANSSWRPWDCSMLIAQDVTITKVDHENNPLISYPGHIVYVDDEQVVARCKWTHDTTYDLGPFLLEPGDIFIEFYYRDRAFNIFSIYDPTGSIKGWYCNVTAAVDIAGQEIRWRDLALDLLVLPDGRQILLDEDEFEEMDPSIEVRACAKRALKTLKRWAQEGHLPFSREPGPSVDSP